VTVPSCLCEVGQKVHPGPTPLAPAVHENDRPPSLNGCEWYEALNAHAMNSVLRLIHAKPRLLMSTFQSGNDHFVVVFPGNVSHCEQWIQMTWGIG
jgi:hypothetical protein